MTKHAIELVVDTNVLGKQDAVPKFVLDGFGKALAEIRTRADVTVVVPWLVLEEVTHHKTAALVEACAGAAKAGRVLKSLVGTEVKIERKPDELKGQLREAILADLNANGFIVIQYAIPNAMLERFAAAAIWRQGPFKNDAPSAFKDTLIAAQAILHQPHAKGKQVVFLTADAAAGKLELFEKGELGKLISLPSMDALKALPDDLTQKAAVRLVRLRNLGKTLFYYPYTHSLFEQWNLDAEFRQLAGRSAYSMTPVPSISLIWGFDQTQFPPFRMEYHGTEVLDQSGDIIRFRSDVTYCFNQPSDYSVVNRTVITERFLYHVYWAAREAGKDLVDAKMDDLKLIDKSRTETPVPIQATGFGGGHVGSISGMAAGSFENPWPQIYTMPSGALGNAWDTGKN